MGCDVGRGRGCSQLAAELKPGSKQRHGPSFPTSGEELVGAGTRGKAGGNHPAFSAAEGTSPATGRAQAPTLGGGSKQNNPHLLSSLELLSLPSKRAVLSLCKPCLPGWVLQGGSVRKHFPRDGRERGQGAVGLASSEQPWVSISSELGSWGSAAGGLLVRSRCC